jgi:molybdopterin converting factor small subunit
MATILIPTPLRKFVGNESKIQAEGSTVLEALQLLTAQYPELQKQLLDDSGNIRSFLRIFKGNADIRSLQKEQTTLEFDAVLSIVPAIAGGKN